MEKEKIKLEQELRIKLIEDGSHRTAINRCVDKILLSEAKECTFEKETQKTTLQKKYA